MISTKGRYSIRILLDLAEHRNGKYIPMKAVSYTHLQGPACR